MKEPDGIFDDVAALRLPPQSLEAESTVLGALLLDNSSFDKIAGLISGNDFYRHEHKQVYEAISALITANKPADVITVHDCLAELGQSVGGLAFINSLAQSVPGSGNIRRYAEIVRERSILRKLIAASDEISASAFNTAGKTVEAIIDTAQGAIFNIGMIEGVQAQEWESMEAGIFSIIDTMQDKADGKIKDDFIPTGLSALDQRLDGGMRPGELIVIGARPSMGKSAMGLTIGVNVASRGLPVGMLSMEMPARQVHARAIALAGSIHLSKIKRPGLMQDADWNLVTNAVEKLRPLPFFTNDKDGLNINHIRSKARVLSRRHGNLGLLVIDYLGLMAGTDHKMPRVYQIEEITKGLKSLAKELHCPILLLVQLNRKVEERADQMPILSDLRDSGSIEQDADSVIFVHRPFKSSPDIGDEWKYYAKVSVAKVRDGDPGYVDLMYIGENLHFLDWPAGRQVPISRSKQTNGYKGL